MQVSRRLLEKGQYSTALDDAQFDKLKGSCREYTLPRSDKSSQVKGWIRGDTKIGPALDVAVSCHQGRCGVEIMINSLFGDGTRSWVRKPVAKARPRQTSNSALHERKWMDVEPGRFDKRCLEVSKLMIRLLRPDYTVPREDDGAVTFQDLASICRSEFTSSSHWSIRTWLRFLLSEKVALT